MRERRICRNISDLRDLLADFEVSIAYDGTKAFLVMEPPSEPQMPRYPSLQLIKRELIPTDPEHMNRRRETTNAIVDLVSSEQFWRCITVSDQMTNFYGHDGGSMPPMFMRGEGRKPSRYWRMTGMTKKAGQAFTIHFESPEATEKFVKSVLQLGA